MLVLLDSPGSSYVGVPSLSVVPRPVCAADHVLVVICKLNQNVRATK